MVDNETNITTINEEDRTFIHALVSLSPEKKTLVKGILIGINLQEKSENVFERDQSITGRQLTLMEYASEKIV